MLTIYQKSILFDLPSIMHAEYIIFSIKFQICTSEEISNCDFVKTCAPLLPTQIPWYKPALPPKHLPPHAEYVLMWRFAVFQLSIPQNFVQSEWANSISLICSSQLVCTMGGFIEEACMESFRVDETRTTLTSCWIICCPSWTWVLLFVCG